jgi:cytochrome b6-f complex iron-sulfur subunit
LFSFSQFSSSLLLLLFLQQLCRFLFFFFFFLFRRKAEAAMAALTSVAASLTLNTKISSCHNGMMFGASTQALTFAPLKAHMVKRKQQVGGQTVCQAAVAADRVPDMGKRNLMNLLLLGAISLPSAGLIGPYLYFFVPPSTGGEGAGVVAKDALGNDITVKGWLESHPPGDRTLAQGLKGDPTYLVVENDGQLATYGVNAVCTHLGCVVPFNKAENKFICPCHGSQYSNQGRVVRGPAPLSLALAHVDVADGKVFFSPWSETDFRTGENPWWS